METVGTYLCHTRRLLGFRSFRWHIDKERAERGLSEVAFSELLISQRKASGSNEVSDRALAVYISLFAYLTIGDRSR